MAVAAVIQGGGLLDAVGKQILQFAEYRIVGVLIGLVVIAFVFCRRWKSAAWSAVEDCIYVCTNGLAVVGGFLVGVVFLFTKPPAIELLSQQAPIIIGLFVPIVSFGYAFPRLRALFSPPGPPPPEAVKRPKHEPE